MTLVECGQRKKLLVSNRTRLFALVTGFVTAGAGVFVGGLFFVIPAPLILGAVIQPRFLRAGRGLICAGALWLSFWVFDVGFFMALENHATGHLGVVALSFVMVLLVILCDLAIVVEEVRMRRA
ncbi:MAG: hypothetical protein ABSD53_12405 [Terriglobales bacterium]